MEFAFHPVAELFPMIEGVEFDELVEDIRKNGLREKIWIYQGKGLDGRNRFRACKKAGVPPEYREWDGQGSLVEFVLSLNFHRRHLSASQRAMVVAKALPMLEEEARQRQAHGQTGPGRTLSEKLPEALPAELTKPAKSLRDKAASFRGKASQQAAAKAHVSEKTVEQAKKVLNKAAPEVVQSVEKGKTAVHKAARLADLPPEEQLQRLQESQARAKRRGALEIGREKIEEALRHWRRVDGAREVVLALEEAREQAMKLPSS